LRSSLGNFGDFLYGVDMRGRVHYPLNNTKACHPFNESDFHLDHLREGSLDGHKPIILVDRGECTFVTKARHIQEFGGVLAIIADNVEFEAANRLIMSDDGTGNGIKIPSFLIGKSDGDMLKEYIHKDKSNNTWSEEETNRT